MARQFRRRGSIIGTVTKGATCGRRSIMQKLRGLAKRGVEMGYKALLASHPRVMKTGRGTFLRVIRQICIVVMLIGLSCDKPAATRPATGPASAPTVKRVHVFISGKVQGVGFRAFTKERA